MKNSLAVVTGATGHIGKAIGLSLKSAGAGVVLHGRNVERSKRLHEETGIEVIAGDLTQPEAVEVLHDRIARHGQLQTLVLASGIYERSDDPNALARQFRANVLGPYALLRKLLPFLVAGQGQVVVINSTQGHSASAETGQFAATQHAMRAIADSLRYEVNAKDVRVLSIFLGRTASERQQAIFATEGRNYQPELLIQPEDVAHVVNAMLTLPRTAEATEVFLRPMHKS